MNMRRKIARSIRDKVAEMEVSHSVDVDAMWHADDLADTVLDALMEPTEEMCARGLEALQSYRTMEEAFKAMIQAAKDGK